MRILAVDDNPFIRDFLPRILEQENFPNVVTAASGASALDILATSGQQFDCLLLDIVMPGMDGITLCRNIRTIEEYRHTPIIMLTLNSDGESLEQAFAAGANDYITKPFEIKTIAHRLRIAERMVVSSEEERALARSEFEENTEVGHHSFGLNDAFHIEGVDQLIRKFSLGNFVSKIPKDDLENYLVFACQIGNAGDLYSNTTSVEFIDVLSTLAKSVSMTVNCDRLLMANCGAGSIMCITSKNSLLSRPPIDALVQEQFDKFGLRFGSGREAGLMISAGVPIHPNAHRTQRVRTTFGRAVDRAIKREQVKLKLMKRTV
ncbi:response regulator [Roseovarius aestuarii]|nr:response regulator [Roseovarius aestuarii]